MSRLTRVVNSALQARAMARPSFGILAVAVGIAVLFFPTTARPAQVDISACRRMYDVLKAMKNAEPQDKVSGMLDELLESPPYQVMFKHYNRSWRPNHLPRDVFKRMILSLQFDGVYRTGENERADAMRSRWTKFYPDLPQYESKLRQLESADLPKLIQDGVRYAKGWLPPGWKIPVFSVWIIPNGGSPAFTIENSQGYDLLQLPEGKPGELDLNWLEGTVAHESHHLGMRSMMPGPLSPADSMAYQVINLTIAEGAATEFISGAPGGCAPAAEGVRFHLFTTELTEAWKQHVNEEEDILNHQAALLGQAAAGQLTEEDFGSQLRNYWLTGAVGRAYVLGADMLGAVYLAFGKVGVFSVMLDPRKLFKMYNAALVAKPQALKDCPRVPDAAVKEALAIGTARRAPRKEAQ